MPRILVALLVLAFAWPAAAQETGGLPLAPGVGKGPIGLAKPMPFVQPQIGASDVQSSLLGNAGSIGQNQGQGATGGTGLGGLGFGGAGFGGQGFGGQGLGGQVTINKTINRTTNKSIANSFSSFNGPVAITRGNNNSVQVQSATGSGPIALQQVNTQGGSGGGNVNSALGGSPRLASGGGNTNTARGGAAIPQRHVRVAPANQ